MTNKIYTIQKSETSVSQTSNSRKFVITKKIAKHGNQAIIVVPRVLEQHLKPGTTCEISIEILDEPNTGTEDEEK